MTWAVCIVGNITSARKAIDERFALAQADAAKTGVEHEVVCCELAKSIILKHVSTWEKFAANKYISITAAMDNDELKMAVRLLPGFVE